MCPRLFVLCTLILKVCIKLFAFVYPFALHSKYKFSLQIVTTYSPRNPVQNTFLTYILLSFQLVRAASKGEITLGDPCCAQACLTAKAQLLTVIAPMLF